MPRCCAYTLITLTIVIAGMAIIIPTLDIDVTVHSCHVYLPASHWFDTVTTIARSLHRYGQNHGYFVLLNHLIQMLTCDLPFLAPPVWNSDLNLAENKTILLVGGSYVPQFLKRALQMGVNVYLLDDAVRTPPHAKALAYGFIPVPNFAQNSILNPNDIIKTVLETGVKFDGVVTLVEDEGPLASRLAERLGLPATPKEAADIARNKYLVRKTMDRALIASPKYALIETEQDIEKAAEIVGFPSFLKPVYGVAASYVSKVRSVEDIRSHFLDFQANVDRDYFPIYHYGTPMLLEGMLEGSEIQLELIFSGGQFITHCFSSQYSPKRDWVVFPTNLTAADKKTILDMAIDTSHAIGITDGVVHYEVFHTPGSQPHIIEVNNRLSRGFLCLQYSHQLTLGECNIDYFGTVIMLSMSLSPLSSHRECPMAAMATFPDIISKTGWETDSACAVYFGLNADEAVAKGSSKFHK